MRIAQLTAMIVRLRLRKEFKHASFSRNYSDNLMVRCQLADGTIGWGEGVPREYVTGETPDGAMEQLKATDLVSQLGRDCESLSDVIELCESYQPDVLAEDSRGRMANAQRCAVELSILDAYGKLFELPLREVTKTYAPAESVRKECQWIQYSSAISSGGFRKELLSSLAMRIYGFAHCKVKVGMNSDHDPMRLLRMRRWTGASMDLRVDANEAWAPDEAERRIAALIPYDISCVEQPVHHDQVDCLAKLRGNMATPIMLDESLTSEHDARRAIDSGTCDLFNIRLSKCGGFLSSLRLAGMAQRAGLGYQMGIHPGESTILSAAGRHFASSVANIRFREGSADRHLLKNQIAEKSMTFGYGGWAPAIDAPGLGVTIIEETLRPMILKTETFKIC